MQITNNLPSNSIAADSRPKPDILESILVVIASGPLQDQVSISSLSRKMANDPSKLSQLQAAYESGTYNVSPSQIANSFLNDAMLS